MAQPAPADAVARLIAPDGVAVFVGDGIPWWWNHGRPGSAGPLPLLDPRGELWSRVRPERTIGGVVHSGNAVIRPGVIRHRGNDRWVQGEPMPVRPERVAALAALLYDAGLEAEVSADIRYEVWRKLLSDVALNALTALTRLPVDDSRWSPT